MITTSNSAQFANDVLLSKGKILVDFWAEWCGPCKAMNPVLEQVAPIIPVVKINVDECSGLAASYQISSIPTFILFEDGKEVTRFTGAMPIAVLLQNLGIDSNHSS